MFGGRKWEMKKWDEPVLFECLKDTTKQKIHYASISLTDPSVDPTVLLQRVFDKTPNSGNCSLVMSQRGNDTGDHT